jgi:hypothetical protein
MLTCHPGVTVRPPSTLAYAWWRNATPISGAAAATHVVTASDETRHLRCKVTVAGDGGVTTVASNFQAIPPEATITESFVGSESSRGSSVTAPVTCSPQAAGRCVITMQMSMASSSGSALAPATVGSATAVIPRGSTRTLGVSLNRTGRYLLHNRRALAVQLTVSGTLLGELTGTLERRTLLLREPGAGGSEGVIATAPTGTRGTG